MKLDLRKLAINTTIVLSTLAVAYLLWEFHQAIFLFVFSLAIAAAARPFVESLAHRGIPIGLAIVLVYLLFIVGLVFIFWAVGSSFINELNQLTNSLTVSYDNLWVTWPQGTTFQQMIVRQLPAPSDLYKGFAEQRQNSAFNGLIGFTMTSANRIGEIVTVLVLSIYWSIDRVLFERLWLSLLPVESRARSRDIWRDIEYVFGDYVRSEVLQSIIAGVVIGFGLWRLGVPYPTLLGIFAGLAWLIPWLGGVIVILPVTLAALSQGPILAIFATLYVIAVLFLLEFVIQPRFIQRRKFSSLLSILLIIALIEPYGLMGLIVAPPLAAALELIFRYNLQARTTSVVTESASRITELRERAQHVRELMANLKGTQNEVGPQATGILSRLEGLIDRSDEELNNYSSESKSRQVPV